jgi:hypothetical protein
MPSRTPCRTDVVVLLPGLRPVRGCRCKGRSGGWSGHFDVTGDEDLRGAPCRTPPLERRCEAAPQMLLLRWHHRLAPARARLAADKSGTCTYFPGKTWGNRCMSPIYLRCAGDLGAPRRPSSPVTPKQPLSPDLARFGRVTPLSARGRRQTLKRKCMTSPSRTTYSLPSSRILPASFAPCSPLHAMKSL